jgi:hypothetical protein
VTGSLDRTDDLGDYLRVHAQVADPVDGFAFAFPSAHQPLELVALLVGQPTHPHRFCHDQSMTDLLGAVVDQAGVPDRSGH